MYVHERGEYNPPTPNGESVCERETDTVPYSLWYHGWLYVGAVLYDLLNLTLYEGHILRRVSQNTMLNASNKCSYV